LADPVHIFVHHRILHQLHARLYLLGVLLSHRDLFLERVPVAQPFAAHLAIADGVDVVLAPVVLLGLLVFVFLICAALVLVLGVRTLGLTILALDRVGVFRLIGGGLVILGDGKRANTKKQGRHEHQCAKLHTLCPRRLIRDLGASDKPIICRFGMALSQFSPSQEKLCPYWTLHAAKRFL
jgi:hypothetical protein